MLAAREHRTVAYLPLCHILGRDIAVTLPLLSKLVPHFGEDVGRPAAHFLRSRADGAVHGAALPAEVRLAGAGRHRQYVAGQTRRLRSRDARGARPGARALGRPRRRIARLPRGASLVFRPLLEKLGLDELELVISGGAPLPAETMALWQMWGVNVCEIYGQTENRRRHHRRPARAFPEARATSAPPPPASNCSSRPLARSWCAANSSSTATGTTRKRRAKCSAGRMAAHRRRRQMGRWRAADGRPRATSSSPRAARRCRPPSSRTCCAPAPTSPRRW